MRSKKFYAWLLAAVVIAVSLMILRTSQPASQTIVVTDNIQTPFAKALPSSTPTPASNSEEAACERPYPESSIWNEPLDWSIAQIHPMSDLMMNEFFKSDDWIGADTSQFTPNM